MSWTEYVACMVRRSEGKSHYGKSKNGWKDSIKMDLKVTGCEGVDCIHLSVYESSGGLF
jgi:hypothetical protein